MDNYQKILQKEFARRVKNNPSYSLRAFARDSGVAHSMFSQLFNGTKTLSMSRLKQIADRLKLSKKTQNALLMSRTKKELEQYQHLRSYEDLLEKKIFLKAKILNPQVFSQMSEWSTWTFLMTLESSVLSKLPKEELAKKLNLSASEFDQLISDLEALKLISRNQSGSGFKKSKKWLVAASSTANLDFKKLHTQVSDRAKTAIYEQTPDERYSASEFISVDEDSYLKIKKLSDEYLNKVQAIAGQASKTKKDRVCSVSLHLFSLVRAAAEGGKS